MAASRRRFCALSATGRFWNAALPQHHFLGLLGRATSPLVLQTPFIFPGDRQLSPALGLLHACTCGGTGPEPEGLHRESVTAGLTLRQETGCLPTRRRPSPIALLSMVGPSVHLTTVHGRQLLSFPNHHLLSAPKPSCTANTLAVHSLG